MMYADVHILGAWHDSQYICTTRDSSMARCDAQVTTLPAGRKWLAKVAITGLLLMLSAQFVTISPLTPRSDSEASSKRTLDAVMMEASYEYNHNNQLMLPLLMPRHRIGSWIGNTWVPPPEWRWHSAVELQAVFAPFQNIAWYGDSTARRSSSTLYAILNQTVSNSSAWKNATTYDPTLHISVAAVDAGSVTERAKNGNALENTCTLWQQHNIEFNDSFAVHMCYRLPAQHHHRKAPALTANTSVSSNGSLTLDDSFNDVLSRDNESWFVFAWNGCFKTMLTTFAMSDTDSGNVTSAAAEYFQVSEGGRGLLQNNDVLVISMGMWELLNRCPGLSWAEVVPRIVRALDQHARTFNTTIVWRTTGFFEADAQSNVNRGARKINNITMHAIDELVHSHVRAGVMPRLTYIHWAGAVEPRSYSGQRDRGDLKPHYGLSSRLVLTQMLANHVLDLRRVERLITASTPTTQV